MKKKWIWIVAAVVVLLGIGAAKSSQDKEAAEQSRAVIAETVETVAPTAVPGSTAPLVTLAPIETDAPTAAPESTAPLVTLAPIETNVPAAARSAPVEPTPEPQPEKDWVLNMSTGKFHKPSCSSVKDIKDYNRQDVHMTRDDVIAMGYEPCGKCHP